MPVRLVSRWRSLSLAQQFMLATFVVLVVDMAGVGWWIGEQIEAGVVDRSAASSALFVESFVSPLLQELAVGDTVTPEQRAELSDLLHKTVLGQQIVGFKVWHGPNRVVYSSEPTVIGREFPMHDGLERGWRGDVAARVTDLHEDENAQERGRFPRLIEIYVPVRQEGTGRIIAVAEFYQPVEGLEQQVQTARLLSWLAVGLATLATYALLIGIVRRANDTITRQQVELAEKVTRLTALLSENEELHERVRRAAARTTEVNERFLRRISAELHDGPAQDLSLALLQLDGIVRHAELCARPCPVLRSVGRPADGEELGSIRASLRRALQEIRAISQGLRLPELEELTLPETVSRAVRVHERRTRSRVVLSLDGLPGEAPLPVKIATYRLIQEALSNAYRHGGGVGQRVRVEADGDAIAVEVSDRGQGFDPEQVPDHGEHLGLVGMRERVESLGGAFEVTSEPGYGARVFARLPLQPTVDPAENERHDGHAPARPGEGERG